NRCPFYRSAHRHHASGNGGGLNDLGAHSIWSSKLPRGGKSYRWRPGNHRSIPFHSTSNLHCSLPLWLGRHSRPLVSSKRCVWGRVVGGRDGPHAVRG